MLAEIVANTRRELAERERAVPIARLREGLTPSTRSLAAALHAARRAGRPGLILEHKPRSPSAGALRPDFDPDAVAAAYAPFADAVSVLTDARWFGGGRDQLDSLRARIDRPLLCKDFIVSDYQVLEARRHGADSVLLMLSVLDDATYRRLAGVAAALGMDVLTEVHDDRELERALEQGARIIGINNRDLRTLRVDLGVVDRLAPRVPGDILTVCESGIPDHGTLRAIAPRVDGFLVGSALMRAPRLDLATRALAFGRVKVCGVTRPEDACAAFAAGASLVGVNLAAVSPRRVDLATARRVLDASPARRAAVFVDSGVEEVVEAAAYLALDVVQLHGDEDAALCRALRARLPVAIELWRAVPGDAALPDPDALAVDRLLLDSGDAARRGGTGRAFDWRALAAAANRDRLVVAGGLGAGNVAAAAALGVHALDVCSGVEQAPGRKDPDKLGAFFAALRAVPRADHGASQEVA